MASAGTATAALMGGGEAPPAIDSTEIYDGTAWTEVNDMNDARYNLASGTVGTTTAGLGTGGDQPAVKGSEEWDGTNWASTVNMVANRGMMGACGTQTAALSAGRYQPAAGLTELYDDDV